MDERAARAATRVETTERRLLDAARLGLARFGTRKLSMTDVAALAGVSRRTLYRHSPSMQDLLDALGADESRRFNAAIADAVREQQPGHRVAAVLRFMADSLGNDHLQQLVFTDPNFVLQRFSTILPELRTNLAALIAREQPTGRGSRRAAEDTADAVIRLAMSHYLLPEADAGRFSRSLAAIMTPAAEPAAAR